MGKILGALVLVVAGAACTPAERQGTTTSSPELTSTSLATTTTSTTEATTTTFAPTTTTTTLMEGNWADVPLVMSGLALGWWDGEGWVQVEGNTDLPIRGGEDYQVALLGTEGKIITGGQQTDNCPTFVVPGVALDGQDSLNRYIEDGGTSPSRIELVRSPTSTVMGPWRLSCRISKSKRWAQVSMSGSRRSVRSSNSSELVVGLDVRLPLVVDPGEGTSASHDSLITT